MKTNIGPMSTLLRLPKIPIALIDSLYSARINRGFDDITRSFSRYGQLSPIRVRRNPTSERFEVVFGNRRLAAARKLGWTAIVAEIVEVSNEDALFMSLSENVDRKDFSDYEKALLFEKLHVTTGKSYAEIAEAMQKSAAFVSQHVAMLYLFPETIAGDEERTKVLCALTENHARVLAKIDNPTERWSTAKLAIKAKISVRELEKLCLKRRNKSGRNRIDRKQTLHELILSIIRGLDARDIRPFSDAMSEKEFSMFSDGPPFFKLDREKARNHLFDDLQKMGTFRLRVEDLQVRLLSENVAYATLIVYHEINSARGLIKARTRGTLLLFNEESWKIIHAHWSTADPLEFLSLYDRALLRTSSEK